MNRADTTKSVIDGKTFKMFRDTPKSNKAVPNGNQNDTQATYLKLVRSLSDRGSYISRSLIIYMASPR